MQSIRASQYPDRHWKESKLEYDVKHQQRRRTPVQYEAQQTPRYEAAGEQRRGQDGGVSISGIECGVQPEQS
jgi:hypothetical protein